MKGKEFYGRHYEFQDQTKATAGWKPSQNKRRFNPSHFREHCTVCAKSKIVNVNQPVPLCVLTTHRQLF